MADADDLIRLALTFPGVAQYPHFDRIAFKARVTFATLAPDRLTANLKFSPDEQALKCEVAAEAFSALPNAWGARGWTVARLAALSEAELRLSLALAYAHAARAPRSKPRRNPNAH
jgi:hypothetical protein